MDVSLNILGLAGLSDDFRDLSQAFQRKVAREAAMAGARVARDKVRGTAPVRTGKLKRGTVAAVAQRSETPGKVTAGVRIKAPRSDKLAPFYWRFLELGSINMHAAPFIRPTWDANLPEIEGTVINRLAQGIDKAITGR